MPNKDSFQKYLDAGMAFTALTRARAEELVGELVQNGEFQRGEAKAKVDELLERSRRSSEIVMTQVRQEVTRQLDSIGISSVEDLAQQVAALLGRTAEAGRAATGQASGGAATAKKTAAKKAPAKKTAATKSAAPTGSATKAAAKKSPARTAAAKKTAATKSAATKSAATKSPAKKAATTKAPGTQAAVTQDGARGTGAQAPGTGSAD